MSTQKVIKKFDFAEYEGRYDESVNGKLATVPEDLSVEDMRGYLYGYTFTEGYAKGEFPDEMSMDYWRDNVDWSDIDDDIDIDDEIDIEDDIDSIIDDDYYVDTLQERKILEAIDSTGDGRSRETALCVTDVGQEYEYMERVMPYTFLEVKRQSVRDGIDCLEFEENIHEIECLYFDISRRFDVGYPKLDL